MHVSILGWCRELNYAMYFYDGSRNAVVMTDIDGKELVVDCIRQRHRLVLMR